ncbi:MAG: hypothetical protein AAGA48_21485 [Myxococcota bacterium]
MMSNATSTTRGLEWPLTILVSLCIVVLVNLAYVWVATQHAPLVESSYETVER